MTRNESKQEYNKNSLLSFKNKIQLTQILWSYSLEKKNKIFYFLFIFFGFMAKAVFETAHLTYEINVLTTKL
jgi:hypothetical protein